MSLKKRRSWKVTQYTQPAMKSQEQVGENVEKKMQKNEKRREMQASLPPLPQFYFCC
jgi:hypothetical protein